MIGRLLRLLRPRPLRAVVDLTLLLPGGMNGGIRPMAFEFLRWIGRTAGPRVEFVFLTNTWTHADLGAIRRPGDRAVCVARLAGRELPTGALRPGDEVRWDTEKERTVVEGDVFYAPLCEELRPTGGVPAVVCHADLLHVDFPGSLAPAEVERREAFLRANAARAARIQTISEFSRRRLSEHLGLPTDRVFVTYVPVQGRLIPGRLSGELAEWAARPYLLYPANFWRHKNHYALLDAYARYRAAAGPVAWRLALTGHPSDEFLGVMEHRERLGLASDVRHWDHLAESDFGPFLAAAGGLVFPSRYEGFGIPLVEAMAAGVPVLANRAGSIEEVAGDAALLADAADADALAAALGRFTADAALRGDLVRRGRARLDRFRIDREAGRLWHELVAVAGSRAGHN